jgi:hypothetical protein
MVHQKGLPIRRRLSVLLILAASAEQPSCCRNASLTNKEIRLMQTINVSLLNASRRTMQALRVSTVRRIHRLRAIECGLIKPSFNSRSNLDAFAMLKDNPVLPWELIDLELERLERIVHTKDCGIWGR